MNTAPQGPPRGPTERDPEAAWPDRTGPLGERLRTLAEERGGAVAELLRETAVRLVAAEEERDAFRRELASRFEEVELLTSVSEILGSAVRLERAMDHLLEDTAAVLGARSAELWVAAADGEALERTARAGESGGSDRIPVADLPFGSPEPPPARAFRQAAPHAGTESSASGPVPWLVVPLRHQALHGARGAIGALSFRRGPGDAPFRPAATRLAGAVASQLAAALENGRLLEESLARERMMVELSLAHDLQIRLLPRTEDFADVADVAARCEPAESVGGDFYQLFRLREGRLGVMLGDVSSHGYTAGLMMALTMSAASLVARERDQPSEVLRGIHHELVRKLESSEMYLTVCYVVLDPVRGRLTWANAGHPHAWRVRGKEAVRLEALNPPLGIAEFDAYAERALDWTPGTDALVLFTDGLSECLRSDRIWSDDTITEIVSEAGGSSAGSILDLLFDLACAPGGVAVDDRTAVVVR